MILSKIVEKHYFHSFECRCLYDVKVTAITNNEEDILTISIGFMKFKSQFDGLRKKKKMQELMVLCLIKS